MSDETYNEATSASNAAPPPSTAPTPTTPEQEAERRRQIAREINTIHQLIHNWHGQKFGPEHTTKIDRHLETIRTLLTDEPVVRPLQQHGQHNHARRLALRLEVFAAYGGKCACCGESDQRVLTIDHIKPLRGRARKDAYKQARREGFPRAKFQVLCLNCNMLKGAGAACTHGQQITSPKPTPAAPATTGVRVVQLVRREPEQRA